MSDSNPKVRRAGFTVEPLLDEVMVYDESRKKAYCLNPTASALYELADGSRSVDDLARDLAPRTGTPADPGLVLFGLEELRRQGLLETAASPRQAIPDAPTRRELLGRLGVAAAALPAVLAIALPRPASGQLTSPGSTGPTGP